MTSILQGDVSITPTIEISSDQDKIIPFPATENATNTKLEYHRRTPKHLQLFMCTRELLLFSLGRGQKRKLVLLPLAGGSIPDHEREGFTRRFGKEYELGEAKAAQLKAAIEIDRRLGLAQLEEKYQFYFARPLTIINVLVRLISWLHCPLIAIKIYYHPSSLLSKLLSDRNL